MFYPTNFPVKEETPLLELLQELAHSPLTQLTPAKLISLIKQTLKHNPHLKVRQSPPLWHLKFVLERHYRDFAPTFYRKINDALIKTKVRSWSGIIPVSVFTGGVGCPFNCVYCANEPNMPKSYFSDEPAVMRAIHNNFDPYKQVFNRLQMLYLSGHPLDKIELIIQGGTFSFYDRAYREEFVKGCFDAANTDIEQAIRTGRLTPKTSASLLDAQNKNETAKQRIIGLTIETRPDFLDRSEIDFLRTLGVTRVEMGVQAPDEQILKLIKRGHGLKEIWEATKLMKDAGLKVTYHLMPGLPGSNPQKDLKMLEEIFTNPKYKPDNLKFYPTSVVKYSELAEWHEAGKYQPYSETDLTELVLKFKKNIVPPWLRIQRLVRDLTTNDILVDTFPSNLRQKLETELARQKIKCPCIRCREIKAQTKADNLRLEILDYPASEGTEHFLQFVDLKNRLYALLRLRIAEGKAIVRELHVYGEATPLGEHAKTKTQHTGLGQKLLENAEAITKAQGINQLSVIAGIGAREYYRKLGYQLEGTYMLKSLV